jgi:hypothetical protein
MTVTIGRGNCWLHSAARRLHGRSRRGRSSRQYRWSGSFTPARRVPLHRWRLHSARASIPLATLKGRSVTIEYRWAENHYERLPALLTDLVGRRVAVIAALGDGPAATAKPGTISKIYRASRTGRAVFSAVISSR